MAQKVVVVTGPTATGKTKLGVALARALNGEVVGADAMQIYQHMDIGTAKPTLEEMQGIPHHMVDMVSPFEQYSVSRYVEEAGRCVDDILSRGKLPILVGGTGLYIESLLSGRDFAPNGGDDRLRGALSAQYDEVGGAAMLEELKTFDPESGAKLHANDKKRIVRAFEVYRLSGKTITRHNLETQSLPPRYDACKIALSFENRQDLYDRIDRRVDLMVQAGLENEVDRLLEMGIPAECTALQAIGYKELIRYKRGEWDFTAAVDAVKRESRRYAKRQISWLRRDPEVQWLLWKKEPDFDMGLRISTRFLENSGIL